MTEQEDRDLRSLLHRNRQFSTETPDIRALSSQAARLRSRRRAIAATLGVTILAAGAVLTLSILQPLQTPSPGQTAVEGRPPRDVGVAPAPTSAASPPTSSSDESADGGGSSPPERVAVQPDPALTTVERRIALDFLEFAASPNRSAAAEVDFSDGPVEIAISNGPADSVTPADLGSEAAWFLTEGDTGGSTSALFVVSSSIRRTNSEPTTFPVTASPVPVCSVAAPADPPIGERIVSILNPEPTDSCGLRFRIDLLLTEDDEISSVYLAVGGL